MNLKKNYKILQIKSEERNDILNITCYKLNQTHYSKIDFLLLKFYLITLNILKSLTLLNADIAEFSEERTNNSITEAITIRVSNAFNLSLKNSLNPTPVTLITCVKKY